MKWKERKIMTVEITCPKCNFSKTIPAKKIPDGLRWVKCPRCKEIFEFVSPEPQSDINREQQEPENGNKDRASSPWEKRDEVGLWHGIYDTFKSVLFSPGQFYRGLKYNDGIKEPMSFGLLLGSVGTMFGVFWQFLVMSEKIGSISGNLLNNFSINLIFLGIIIISPFFVILNMFVSGAVTHLCLLLVRGGRHGFEGTFRVVAFSQATQIIGVFPFIGGLIGWFWHIIVIIIGLRNIHESPYLRVIAAVLIALLLKVLIMIPFFLIRSFMSGIMTYF